MDSVNFAESIAPDPEVEAEQNFAQEIFSEQKRALEIQQQDAERKARDVDAAKQAEAIRLSQEEGVPPSVAYRAADRLRKPKPINWASLQPSTAKVAADPTYTPVLQSDVDKMSSVERVLRGFGQQLSQTNEGIELSDLGVKWMDGTATMEDRARIAAIQAKQKLEPVYNDNYLTRAPGIIGSAGLYMGTTLARTWDEVLFGAGTGAVAGAAGGAAGLTVFGPLGTATGFVGGGGAGLLAGASVGANVGFVKESYDLLRGETFLQAATALDENGEPLDETTAYGIAMFAGGAGALLERAGAISISKAVPGLDKLMGQGSKALINAASKSPALRTALSRLGKIGRAGLTEGATELAQAMLSLETIIAAGGVTDESGNKLADTRLETYGQSFVEGAIGGAGIATAGQAAQKGGEKVVSFYKERAKAKQQSLVEMGDTLRKSAAAQNSPETIKKLAEQMDADGAPSMSTSADALVTLFQQEGVSTEVVEQNYPELANELDLASETGAEVKLTPDTLTKLMQLEGFSEFAQDVRTSPEEMTGREATAETEAMEADLGALTEEDKATAVEASQREEVKVGIRDQLVAAGQEPSVAETLADFHATQVETMAGRVGVDPVEFAKRYNLQVVNGELSSGGDQAMFQQTPEFQNWFGDSKVVDEQGKPLVVYHGTNANAYSSGSFDVFRTAGERNASFFSTSKGLASQYGEETYATYLNIQNPVVVDMQGRSWTDANEDVPISGIVTGALKDQRAREKTRTDAMFAELESDPEFAKLIADITIEETPADQVQIDPNSLEGRSLGFMGVDGDTDSVVKKARRLGYDGVIFKNVMDSPTATQSPVVSDVYAVFSPTQIKSVNNRGTFDPADPNILFQDMSMPRRETPEAGATTGVSLRTSLARAYEIATDKVYTKGRDLKLDLQQASLDAQAEQGLNLTTLDDENIDRLADFVFEDAIEALQDNANAIGWYDRTVTAALETVAELYPEVLTSDTSKLQFIWALAVTSNGIKVDKNFDLAGQAYETLKSTGKFPTNMQAGQAAAAINSGLAQYHKMLDKFDGDHVKLAKFMNSQVTVKEIESEYDVKISGEGKGTLVRGASILGPKIGNGFFSNMYGNFDALTMDRWLMRSVGRWRGTLVFENKPMINAKTAEIKSLLASVDPETMSKARALYKQGGQKIGKGMSVADIHQLAVSTAKLSMDPKWRSSLNEIGVDGQNLRKAANGLAKYLDGQVEAPAGARERIFLRNVFTAALDRLNDADDVKSLSNQSLTMSDLQALLWYPEKRLYDTAKQSEGESRGYEDDEAPDYANAARKFVSSRLGRTGQAGRAGQRGRTVNAGQRLDTTILRQDLSSVDEGRVGPGGDTRGQAAPSPLVERLARYEGRPRPVDGEAFSAAMQRAGEALGPLAAQVSTVDPSADVQRFLLDDGATGFALDGDNIIGVFSMPGSPRGAAQRVLAAAVEAGGRRLDGFNTFLPKIYAKGGFRAVAKLPFDPEYAPSVSEGALGDWDADAMESQAPGWGNPDVTFMVYDPENATAETDNLVTNYDEGIAAQQATKLSQQARGFIEFTQARDIFKVTLTGKANLSTFLHESGHYWLEVMQDLAGQENAPEQLVADLATIREWAGVAEGEKFEVKHHEKWAQGFEKYLMEGRAPTNALQQAFGRFKAWLSFVYRKIGLDVQLTDEVRGVMDRLIADDQAIAEARTQVGIGQMPMSQEELSLTDAEYQKYSEAWLKAREAEKAELDNKALADYQAEQKAAWREGIAKHVEDLTAQLKETKGHIALTKLEERELKLDKASIPAEWQSMARGLTSERGIDLDSYATSSGWNSGQEMLDAITIARAEARNIPAKARQMMIEEHGHLTPVKLADAALMAVHSDETMDVSLAEFRALADKAGIKVVPGLSSWMRRQAEDKVGALTKRQLEPGRWRRAEIKAAKESATAAAKGDTGEAALAKRRQMMAAAMYRASAEAQESVDKARRYLLPFTTNKRRGTVGKAGEMYLDAIDELLEGVSLKQISGKASRRLNTLNDLIAHAAENEEALNIPPDLVDQARRKNFADMTIDEIQGLRDSVVNIWHLARLKNKLRDGKMKRDMDQAMEEAERTADAAMKSPEIKEKFTKSKIDNGVAKLQNFRAFLTKTEFMLSWLDGTAAGGLLHRTLFQPFADAGHESYKLNKQFKENLIDKLRDMPREQRTRWNSKRTFLGKQADGATIIAAALNLGTELNKDRLVSGEQVTEQQLRAEIDAFMTKEDWEIVQLIWDQTNTLWPHVERVAQKATGLKPPKQDALPVETKFGTFPGGYYPIVYDPERGDLGSRIETKTDALFGNDFASNPVLANGFTKARRDQVPSGNPLKLDLGILSNHLAEVVHYVTHYDAVDQANRMIKNRQFKAIVTKHLGDDYHRAMRRWLQDIARNQDTPHDTKHEAVGKAMKYLRGGTSIATMGYNVFTAMKQHLGLTTALDALPAKYLLHGIKRAYLDPLHMQVSAYKEAMAKSKELPSLIREFDRDVKMVTDAYRKKATSRVIDKVVENAFVPMGYMQAMVNVSVWIGAHAKAVDEGSTDSQAVNLADAIVRQTQGTGKIKDMAGIQRGTEINRIMSMFYSWMSVMFNRMDDMSRQQKREGIKNIPNLARRITVAFMMTTLAEEAGRRAYDELMGKEDDEDEAGYILTVLLKTGDLAIGTLPFIRTFLSFEGAYRKQLTPVGGIVEDIDRGSKAIVDIIAEGEAPSRSEGKAIARGLSAATRKPGYGIYRMFDEWFGEDVFGE